MVCFFYASLIATALVNPFADMLKRIYLVYVPYFTAGLLLETPQGVKTSVCIPCYVLMDYSSKYSGFM
jgi:hypothetical protein